MCCPWMLGQSAIASKALARSGCEPGARQGATEVAQAVVAPELSALGAPEIYRGSRALNGIAVLATPEQARVASRWKPARRRP